MVAERHTPISLEVNCEPRTNSARIRSTLVGHARSERGFLLVEQLVVIGMMVVVLMAIATAADTGRVVSSRDTELALAVSESQPGLDRMVRELRQAVAINPTGTGTGQCVARANCVDFNIIGPPPTRSPYRVRLACLPLAGSATTSCVRYVSASFSIAATAQSALLVERVLNFDPAAATPVFRYRKKDGSELAAGESLALARTVDVSIQVPAKGNRKTGFAHNIVLHDGAQLKNIDIEAAP